MNISMNLPALILVAPLVFCLCVLILCCSFHQFCKGLNQSEEAKTWNAARTNDDDTNPGSGGDPADAWKKG